MPFHTTPHTALHHTKLPQHTTSPTHDTVPQNAPHTTIPHTTIPHTTLHSTPRTPHTTVPHTTPTYHTLFSRPACFLQESPHRGCCCSPRVVLLQPVRLPAPGRVRTTHAPSHLPDERLERTADGRSGHWRSLRPARSGLLGLCALVTY